MPQTFNVGDHVQDRYVGLTGVVVDRTWIDVPNDVYNSFPRDGFFTYEIFVYANPNQNPHHPINCLYAEHENNIVAAA